VGEVVEDLLGPGVAVGIVPDVLRVTGFGVVLRRDVARAWQRGLVGRDMAFLAAVSGKDVALQYDSAPVTGDVHTSHITASWREAADDGTVRYQHHTLRTAITPLNDLVALKENLDSVFKYLADLSQDMVAQRLLPEDDIFGPERVAVMYTDRAVGKLPWARAYEPVHRVHRILLKWAAAYSFDEELTFCCHAANDASTSAAFAVWMKKKTGLQGLVGILWTRATSGRFGTAYAACWVLSVKIKNRRLLDWYLEYLSAFNDLTESCMRRKMTLGTLFPAAVREKVDMVAECWELVLYPLMRDLWARCSTEVDPADCGTTEYVQKIFASYGSACLAFHTSPSRVDILGKKRWMADALGPELQYPRKAKKEKRGTEYMPLNETTSVF
jgi:hypothetical protein